ncbi:hypothetical protein CLOM_g12671 [Closterium sp. NIES-68]|nr:hypothetical protein CLOM_g12671 [Closterium sp. NIES-68]
MLSPEAHPSPSPKPSTQRGVDPRLKGEVACIVSAHISSGSSSSSSMTLKEYLARANRERRKLPLHVLVDLAMQLAKSSPR